MEVSYSKTVVRDINCNMAAPGQIKRTKSPRSPRPSHCPIADSDVEVELEIQDAPPYRILPKVRKPKTPPPPRPCRKPDNRKPRSSSFRSPKSRGQMPEDDDIEDFNFYHPPFSPKQVSFKEDLETVIPDEHPKTPPARDIIDCVLMTMPDKLSPVVTLPGAESPTEKYHSVKSYERPQFFAFDPSKPIPKPEIKDVKIVKKICQTQKAADPKNKMRTSQSAEELNRLDIFLELSDLNFDFKNQCLRSSFVDPDAPVTDTRRSVYIDLGDYQTLLKHSKNEEHVYSLPQPQCYGDDTLRAVKMITAKYDTFQRRQIQAESFCSGEKKSEEDLAGTGAGLSDSPPIPPSAPAAHKVTEQVSEHSTTVPPEAVTDIVRNVPAEDIAEEQTEVKRPVQDMADAKEPEAKSQDGPGDDADSSRSGGMTVKDGSGAMSETDGYDVMSETDRSGVISEKDICRIDLFYRSVGTEIVVSQCVAELYKGMLVPGTEDVGEWRLYCQGVPVFVLNTGLGRRTRELCIVVAEQETGFPLWRDRICYLTYYAQESATEHTFFLTECLSKKGKLKFRTEKGAEDFFQWFKDVTSDPNDDLWKVSSKRSDRRKRFKMKGRYKKPDKKDISQPCNFSHVTKVDFSKPSCPRSFAAFVKQKETRKKEELEGEEFRPRLPTT